jgi:His-Xaa-Ser system protein HxsD
MAAPEGFPEALADVDLGRASLTVSVDDTLYPLDAVYGAAYVFLDRCYVLLDRAPGRFRITLADKKAALDGDGLRALAGELANELLSCAWRHRITVDNRAMIEAVTMQAIASAMGPPANAPPSLEELAKFDFTEEPLDDPLGIAVSWEEKYKKKAKPEDGK